MWAIPPRPKGEVEMIRKGMAAGAIAAIGLLTGMVAPANAAATTPAATTRAACTSWRTVHTARSGADEVALQYNSSCHYVRAYMIDWDDSPGWEIWVYNKVSGATAAAYNPHVVTTSVNDWGMLSHACVQQK